MHRRGLQKAGKFIASFLPFLPITCLAEPILLDLRHEPEGGSPFASHQTSLIKRQQLLDTYMTFVPSHSEFYVNMAVGSPAQQIKFAVTVLEDTWLPGPLPSDNYCNVDVSTMTLPQYNLCYQSEASGTFNPSKSNSYKNETVVQTFNASVTYAYGYYGIDNWTLGQTNINNVTFGVATNYSFSPPLGLGVYPNFGSKSVETLPQALKRQGLVDIVAYGVYLNDWRANTGQLSIGSVDISKYDGDLHTFDPQVLNTLVPLQGLDLVAGGKTANLAPSSKSYLTTIQLGNSGLYLPDNVMTALASRYNGKYDANWGGYLCDCSEGNTDDKLKWNFDGISVTSPIDQLIIPAVSKNGTRWKLPGSDTDACELRMASSAPFAPINFGLGTPFLRGAYAVFDFTNNQTSIAQAKINVTTQNLVPINESLKLFNPKGDGANVHTMSLPVPTVTGTGGATSGGANRGDNGGGSKSHTGAIVGGVVGGLAVLALIIGGALLFIHFNKKKNKAAADAGAGQEYPPVPPPAAGAAAGAAGASNEYKGHENNPPRPVSELPSPMSPPPPPISPPPGEYGQQGQQNWGNPQQYQHHGHGYPQVPQPQQYTQQPDYRPPAEMP